ncbi:odorant receptor 67d-like [Anopheles maculipalpis]|uniref:odorant receptor 67d-like n=1 Tax=Anopheles maculipalpis TaxID=1496333 RepID=UPI002158E1D0|nr:odorant receptor 67d-like [Anopheles maculipalpis]
MKSKLSHDLYVKNLNSIRWYASFVGLDIMEPDYKPNIFTILALIAVCLTLLSEFYTVWYYWPNLVKLMESAAIYGILIQGIAKFYTALRYRKFFEAMYNRLDRFHYEHRQHEKNNATLLLLMQRIRLVTKLIMMQIIVSGLILSLNPALQYLLQGERAMPYAIILAFTDPEIMSHFLLNLAVQYYLLVVGLAGFVAAESVLILFVTSVAGFADVLKNKIDEMNTVLLDNEHNKDRTAVKTKLREILMLHQRVLEYENDLEKRYYLNNWVQVASSVFNLTGALFGCYVSNSFTMYALAIAVVIQLFELCLLGTILSIKNEEIEHAFYNSLWYLMDRAEKKDFMIMFHKSQHAIEMTVASMAPLNVVLFIAIMQKIYGYAMMLMSFLE